MKEFDVWFDFKIFSTFQQVLSLNFNTFPGHIMVILFEYSQF